MAKKRTWPPCVKCGKAQGTRAGKLCSRCWKESLAAGTGERRKVADLRPHPRNAGIYSDGPDEGFVDSVRRNGVLTALLITPDGLIIAGHKRWAAARLAGREDVPVVVIAGLDDDRALELLVESNLQRAKTNEQIGREADALWPVYERRAKERQEGGVPIPGSEGSDGETRHQVGAAVGVAGITAERARAVVRHLDDLEAAGDDTRLYALRAELSRSIKGAWELMRSWTRPGMPADAPDLPEPPAQPEDKEAADHVFGPDGDWPSQPMTKEGVDDLAGPDLEREDTEAGLNELSQQIGDTAGRDERPAAGPQIVRLDPFGVPLSCQPGAEEAFATAEAMAELVDVFRNAGRAMTKIARQGGAELLRRRMKPVAGRSDDALRHVSVDAENAVLALTQTMPACCRCPECHSRGLAVNDAGCGLCGGRPYVTAHQLAGVDQRLIDAMRRELAVPGKGAA